MRKILFSLIFAGLLLTPGCRDYIGGRTEINNLEFIQAIGIDTSAEKQGYCRITITSERVMPGGNATGSEQKSSNIICSEGRTAFEAIRNIHTLATNQPFIGHVKYILIGEQAAKNGLLKYLDFLMRDHEIRLNAKVLIVKGDRAENFLSQGSTQQEFVFKRLESLMENLGGQSVSREITSIDLLHTLDKKYLGLVLPTVELVKNKSQEQSQEAVQIKMSGLAIFKKDKLLGYLDPAETRGLNWLTNKIENGIIVVKSSGGNNVSLEIINSNVKAKPKIANGQLTVTYIIEMSSNIGEIQAAEDIFSPQKLEFLNQQQQKIIRREAERAIRIAQEQKSDFIDTGTAVYHKYPYQWEDHYLKEWPEYFSDLKLNVTVHSKINRTYDIQRPTGSEEEGQ